MAGESHDIPWVNPIWPAKLFSKTWGLNPLVCIVFGGNLQGHQHLADAKWLKMMQNCREIWKKMPGKSPSPRVGCWAVFFRGELSMYGDLWGFSSKPWVGTSRLFLKKPTAWDLGAPEVAAICNPHTKIVLEMSDPPGCWMNKLRFRCDSTVIPSHTISGSKLFHRYVCQTGSTWLTLLFSWQCPVLIYGNEYWPRTISPVISLKII